MTTEQDYESSPDFDYIASPFGLEERSVSTFADSHHEATQHPIIDDVNQVSDVDDVNVDDVSNININNDDDKDLVNSQSSKIQSDNKDKWECSSCTYHNKLSVSKCEMCFLPKSGVIPEPKYGTKYGTKNKKNLSSNKIDDDSSSDSEFDFDAFEKDTKSKQSRNNNGKKGKAKKPIKKPKNEYQYQFGDITKATVNATTDAVKNYKFGDITKGTLGAVSKGTKGLFGW